MVQLLSVKENPAEFHWIGSPAAPVLSASTTASRAPITTTKATSKTSLSGLMEHGLSELQDWEILTPSGEISEFGKFLPELDVEPGIARLLYKACLQGFGTKKFSGGFLTKK